MTGPASFRGFLKVLVPRRLREPLGQLRLCIRHLGLCCGTSAFRACRSRAVHGLIRVRVPGPRLPLLLRASTSDIEVFRQVYLGPEYDLPFDFTPQVIVDGGANIGCVSRRLAARFPSATILAVEPDPENASLLRCNTRELSRVRVIEAALWPTKCSLSIVDPRAAKWSVRVQPQSAGPTRSVQAITMADILALTPTGTVDLLKLDIEGAEMELFSAPDTSWLRCVRMLVIELHERYRQGCTETVMSRLPPDEYALSIAGEKIVAQHRHWP